MTSPPRSDMSGPPAFERTSRLTEFSRSLIVLVGAVIFTVFLSGLTSMMNAAPRYCGGTLGLPGSCGAVPTALSCEHAVRASNAAAVISGAMRRPGWARFNIPVTSLVKGDEVCHARIVRQLDRHDTTRAC